MFKRIVWLLASVIVILVIYFGVTLYKDFTKEADPQAKEIKDEQDITENNVNINDQTNQEKNPFNQGIKQPQLYDEIIRDYIHKMSHQKVIAEPKWGFYQITNKRIDWLLEGLEITEAKLQNKDVYQDILQRWREGDFSRIDQDHNKIWSLQGGTIGKATGIMSEAEEEKYITKTKEGR